MNIYIVTTGEYSDYTIRGVFSTQEKAAKYAAMLEGANDVDNWTVDSEEDKVLRTVFTSRIDLLSGLITNYATYTSIDLPTLRTPHDPSSPKVFYRNGKDGKDGAYVVIRNVIARSYVSQEHADDLATKKRQSLLVSVMGVNNLVPSDNTVWLELAVKPKAVTV